MDVQDLLTELFGRVDAHVHRVVEGLDPEALRRSPAPGTNPVGWLVWHLTRVQDHHIAEVAGQPQVWVGGDWAARFGLEPDPDNNGYGHSADDVAAVQPESGSALVEYHDAVTAQTGRFLATITPDDLDGIVDRRWDPPVTLAVRLISIADDDIQHAGQAAYVRGLLDL
jgi:uncharacterized damage-inducible protein DinB